MTTASILNDPDTPAPKRAVCGWLGFLIGAAALIMALTIFWAGPFAPQQTTSVTLGELAAETGKSMLRSVAGLEQPAPEPVTRDVDDYLKIAVAILGGVAIILALTSFIRREALRPAIAAFVLGTGAVVFQFFAWTVMMFVGALIIMALLHSFSGVLEGLFGG